MEQTCIYHKVYGTRKYNGSWHMDILLKDFYKGKTILS